MSLLYFILLNLQIANFIHIVQKLLWGTKISELLEFCVLRHSMALHLQVKALWA